MSGTTDVEIPAGMHIEGEAEAPPDGERQLSPRELQMRAIAERHQQMRAAEMQLGDEYEQNARAAGLTHAEDDPEPDPAPEPGAEALDAAPPAAAPPAPVQQPAPPAQPSVRVLTVDGQQVAVTDEQLEQLARLGMITNTALHQARNEWQPPAPVAHEPPKALVTPDEVRETVKKIQYGGEEDGAAALAGLINHVVTRVPAAPAIDTNAVVQRAVTASMAQQQLAADTQTIRTEYEDIFAHPQRTFLAKANVEALRARDAQLGRFRPDIEVYREAGNMVREAMGLSRPGSDEPSPALQAPSVVSRADVIERKRSAPRQTTIDRRVPAPETPRPPSGSELVERMRAQRGQSSMR